MKRRREKPMPKSPAVIVSGTAASLPSTRATCDSTVRAPNSKRLAMPLLVRPTAISSRTSRSRSVRRLPIRSSSEPLQPAGEGRPLALLRLRPSPLLLNPELIGTGQLVAGSSSANRRRDRRTLRRRRSGATASPAVRSVHRFGTYGPRTHRTLRSFALADRRRGLEGRRWRGSVLF